MSILHSVVMPASVLGTCAIGLAVCSAGSVFFGFQYAVKTVQGWVRASVIVHLKVAAAYAEAAALKAKGDNDSSWQ